MLIKLVIIYTRIKALLIKQQACQYFHASIQWSSRHPNTSTRSSNVPPTPQPPSPFFLAFRSSSFALGHPTPIGVFHALGRCARRRYRIFRCSDRSARKNTLSARAQAGRMFNMSCESSTIQGSMHVVILRYHKYLAFADCHIRTL